MYPMGRERWNTNSCVSLGVILGMRKPTDRTSYILTHNLM